MDEIHVIGLPGVGNCLPAWEQTQRLLLVRGIVLHMLEIPNFWWQQRNGKMIDLEEYPELIWNQIKELSLTKPFFLLGHSMGGILAVACASHPKMREMLSGVIVVSTPVFGKTSTAPLWLKAALCSWKIIEPISRMFSFRYSQTYRDIWTILKSGDIRSFSVFLRYYAELVDLDLLDRIENMHIPIKVIRGANDFWVRWANGDQLDTRFNEATVVSIANCGHSVQIDQPERLTQEIHTFVTSNQIWAS